MVGCMSVADELMAAAFNGTDHSELAKDMAWIPPTRGATTALALLLGSSHAMLTSMPAKPANRMAFIDSMPLSVELTPATPLPPPAPSAFSRYGPPGPRVVIQRSLPPLPPGRLDVKISVPQSRDRTGCESTN